MHTFIFLMTVFCLCFGRCNSFDLMKTLTNIKDSVYEKAIQVKDVVVDTSKQIGGFVKRIFWKAEEETVKDINYVGDVVVENAIKAENEIAKEVVKDIKKVEEFFQDWHLNKNCSCRSYTCSCYVHLEIPQISLNSTCNLSVTYLVDEIGFRFVLIHDGNAIINSTLSVSNPPPLCTGSPFVRQLANLCFRFHDLGYKDMQLTGCARLEAELDSVLVKKMELGCFKIPTIFLL